MSNDARKKEKRRLKREKKKAEMRREASVSPYRRVAQGAEVEACYINSNWETEGIAAIQVILRKPQGGLTLASFLIDLWCAGLKDAYGGLDFTREDIEFNLARARDHYELKRIDVETVRQLVSGSIRFARQNGFRLPAHYDRWTTIIGGVGDAQSANLSRFGKDGKLLWVGPLDQLRQRLIGCTVEEFISRPDVEFVAEVTDSLETDDELEDDEVFGEEEFDQLVEQMREEMDGKARELLGKMQHACAAAGESPDPNMEAAVSATLALLAHQTFIDKYDDNASAAAIVCAAEDILAENAPEVFDEDGAVEDGIPDYLQPACEQMERLITLTEEAADSSR